ncbi:unnamed protein product [Mycena citricolor]|uniref:cysteine synthase n=1 Tax=Mycena citricolor TaxID=2018698 RepID=A0AAD2Q733_9AGAR|nr:unnamed protein product [Mycena citricolor]CAK5281232.1 unnamed protein product [Mycena citricolor]
MSPQHRMWHNQVIAFSFPTSSRLMSLALHRHVHPLALGLLIGITLSISSSSVLQYLDRRRRRAALSESAEQSRPIELRVDEVLDGLPAVIGNTPLIRVPSLSNAMGVEILGKAEFLNPGGSVKDRVAGRIIDDAERLGLIHPYTGSRIFEGTSGSTGISLAMVGRARGYDVTIVVPDDMATDKLHALRSLGADVEQVRPASIVDKKQYVNIAKRRAQEFSAAASSESTSSDHPLLDPMEATRRGFFADQFENRSNYDAHFSGTGPELWRQTNGNVQAFVSGAGTGGTIAGVGRFLKSMDADVVVCLADPEGSGLYNKVKYGVLFDQREKEGTRRRHQVDTVVEGIGLNRLTQNLNLALPVIDDAFRVTDAEAVAMARYVMRHDGIFIGSSSACNLVASVRLAQKMGWSNGERITTVLCDSGSRHYSKFWNDEYLKNADIPIDLQIIEDLLSA